MIQDIIEFLAEHYQTLVTLLASDEVKSLKNLLSISRSFHYFYKNKDKKDKKE
ncbi:hypothetical protein [Chryseobacterium gambrini]|uniref:Uncharacterized protein n=1 Tax=Chryseobacterium gambrini TaxID=373672 RepID=A0ABM8K4P0_9FLAO|nr:hypothetical protein CRDW_12740 [Chryseobacterium gambrini]